MINSLFSGPQHHLTPEGVIDDYMHLDEIAMLVGCPRCGSLHVKTLDVETRRLTVCHDCGIIADAPTLN